MRVRTGKPISVAYRAFLRHPAPRGRWIWSGAPALFSRVAAVYWWVSARSVAYALSVVGAMFRWWIQHRYLLASSMLLARRRAGSTTIFTSCPSRATRSSSLAVLFCQFSHSSAIRLNPAGKRRRHLTKGRFKPQSAPNCAQRTGDGNQMFPSACFERTFLAKRTS